MASEQENTNLQFLKVSRKKLKEGDVFAFKLLDGPFRFGRVIRAEMERPAPMPGSNLVYVYDATAQTPEAVPLADLSPARLLVPPTFTNRQGWLRGYFLTVNNEPLKPEDLLRTHCFWRGATEKYVGLAGEPMPGPVEPCGQWALVSHRWFDDAVSKAVGLPPAPD